MVFPGYEATMLAIEANGVIGLRLTKIAYGGIDAGMEINLMVQEKFDAAAEALNTLVGGGGVEFVLSGYRRRVTLNARRLSPERKTPLTKSSKDTRALRHRTNRPIGMFRAKVSSVPLVSPLIQSKSFYLSHQAAMAICSNPLS